MCLSNVIIPQLIALESCPSSQKTRQDFEPAMEKNILVLFYFVNNTISEVGFWPFWVMLPGLGPNC